MINYDELSQQNKTLIKAHKRGYRCTIGGYMLNPRNKKLSGSIDNRGYRKTNYTSIKKDTPIYNHRLQAYQKYGNRVFEKGIQVRHLNGNALDNSWSNIAIGTASENQMDKLPEIRLKFALNATEKVRLFNNDILTELFSDKYEKGMSYTELMKKYNICSKGTLSFIINKSIFAKNYNLVC